MKKKKLVFIILSVLCIALFIGTLVNIDNYKVLMESSKRPSDETYVYHKAITQKLNSLTVDGIKYIKSDNSYTIPENLDFGKSLGIISDFNPSFKKYVYSVNARVFSTVEDKNILKVIFSNGETYYFISEKHKEQYK